MDEAVFIARFRAKPSGPRAPHPGAYAVDGYACDIAAFARALESVGGTMHVPVTRAALGEAVSAFIEIAGHRRVVAAASAVALLPPNPRIELAADPGQAHQWHDVDLALIAPELGVCENAAMLTTADSLPERGLAFLGQHVLALLDTRTLVADLHAAYGVIAGRKMPHHLTWISGPSKTADIEQTLVIGAHGCRSLVVMPYA